MEPRIAARAADNGRLDSWKEIAAYLRRGARTVQRWEREEGLPVRRLQHEKLGSVYAFKHELDAWFSRRDGGRPERPASSASPSVAVLPFSDLSAAGGLRYLCDGLAEDIALALSRIEGLRTAMLPAGIRDPAARALLTGSVRRSGERLRIVVRLSDVASGFEIWSDRFDRTAEDLLELQDEIAERVKVGIEESLWGTGPGGPVPVASRQRVGTTSLTPADVAYSRGSREGMTA